MGDESGEREERKDTASKGGWERWERDEVVMDGAEEESSNDCGEGVCRVNKGQHDTHGFMSCGRPHTHSLT